MPFEKSNVWLKTSKSGNGFTIKVGDKIFVGSVENLSRLLNGEIRAVNLSVIPQRK